jgi:hypothetical protein
MRRSLLIKACLRRDKQDLPISTCWTVDKVEKRSHSDEAYDEQYQYRNYTRESFCLLSERSGLMGPLVFHASPSLLRLYNQSPVDSSGFMKMRREVHHLDGSSIKTQLKEQAEPTHAHISTHYSHRRSSSTVTGYIHTTRWQNPQIVTATVL